MLIVQPTLDQLRGKCIQEVRRRERDMERGYTAREVLIQEVVDDLTPWDTETLLLIALEAPGLFEREPYDVRGNLERPLDPRALFHRNLKDYLIGMSTEHDYDSDDEESECA